MCVHCVQGSSLSATHCVCVCVCVCVSEMLGQCVYTAYKARRCLLHTVYVCVLCVCVSEMLGQCVYTAYKARRCLLHTVYVCVCVCVSVRCSVNVCTLRTRLVAVCYTLTHSVHMTWTYVMPRVYDCVTAPADCCLRPLHSLTLHQTTSISARSLLLVVVVVEVVVVVVVVVVVM